jgi:hypothetical protein
MPKDVLRVSKLSAAVRQLDCAIELWFFDKDEVSIYTLVTAAYQIIYDINKIKGTDFQSLHALPAIAASSCRFSASSAFEIVSLRCVLRSLPPFRQINISSLLSCICQYTP